MENNITKGNCGELWLSTSWYIIEIKKIKKFYYILIFRWSSFQLCDKRKQDEPKQVIRWRDSKWQRWGSTDRCCKYFRQNMSRDYLHSLCISDFGKAWIFNSLYQIQIVGQTKLFGLDRATNLVEKQLWIQIHNHEPTWIGNPLLTLNCDIKNKINMN